MEKGLNDQNRSNIGK